MTFGIWNSMEKRFIFGIAAETPRKAERAFRKTCINWRKWRYEIKPIPEGFKNPRNPHYSHLRRKEPTMNANEIIIPARLSYANIWEARQTMEGDRMQYSCSLLIPKSDTKTVQAIRAMMNTPDGKRLMALLGADGGKTLREAANAVQQGNEKRAQDTMAPLLSNPEVQKILSAMNRNLNHG